MQELLLFSQIPAVREHQVLGILAGVTEQQPTPICEQHLIYAQVKIPETAATKRANAKQAQQKQQVQQQRLSYQQLVRDVSANDDGTTNAGNWRFRAEQTPASGETEVISRAVDDHLASEDEVARFRQGQWYKFSTEYTLTGNRFVHNNIIIRIYRVLAAPTLKDPVTAPAPAPNALQAVDKSGSWIAECVVRVEDGTNATLTGTAKSELTKFKELMHGALNLYAPDRLTLDTRVKLS